MGFRSHMVEVTQDTDISVYVRAAAQPPQKIKQFVSANSTVYDSLTVPRHLSIIFENTQQLRVRCQTQESVIQRLRVTLTLHSYMDCSVA